MNIIWVAVLFLYSFYGWASDIYYHFQHLCSYDFIIILWERNNVGVISDVTSSDFFFLCSTSQTLLITQFYFWKFDSQYLSSTKFFTPRFEKKIMSTETVSFLLSKIEWVAKTSEEKLWDIPTSTCSQCDL